MKRIDGVHALPPELVLQRADLAPAPDVVEVVARATVVWPGHQHERRAVKRRHLVLPAVRPGSLASRLELTVRLSPPPNRTAKGRVLLSHHDVVRLHPWATRAAHVGAAIERVNDLISRPARTHEDPPPLHHRRQRLPHHLRLVVEQHPQTPALADGVEGHLGRGTDQRHNLGGSRRANPAPSLRLALGILRVGPNAAGHLRQRGGARAVRAW